MNRVVALVPAAGVGKRMGADQHKAFVTYEGHSLLWHTLSRLSQVKEIEHIVVAFHADDLSLWETTEKESTWKPLTPVIGGETRTHSVENAFKKASELVGGEDFYACIHDAARIWIEPALVSRVIQAAFSVGASGCGVSVTDTVKEKQANGHWRTLNRECLKSIQTPQVIRSDLLVEAYDLWHKNGKPAMTDDLQLLESSSVPFALVEGSFQNVKVTFEDDLIL